MMAQSTLGEEETNHLRAVYLGYNIAPKAVRKYFDSLHPPADLVRHLAADKHNLQKIKGSKDIIKPFQWEKLYPPAGTSQPVSTDFDVTLLICLIRNMTPKEPPPPFGFDKLPDKAHTSNGAHLARIKFYRNSLAHSSDGNMTNPEFQTLWNDLEMAIVGIGGGSFKKEVIEAKSIVLDHNLAEILRKIIEQEKRYLDLSKDVESHTADIEKLKAEINAIKASDEHSNLEMKIKLDQLESRLKHKDRKLEELEKSMEDCYIKKSDVNNKLQIISERLEHLEERTLELERRNDYFYDTHKLIIKKWEEEDELFLVTEIVEDVFKSLKKESCITIIGHPGIGKSATCHHVALTLGNSEEKYMIIPCNNPTDIVKFYREGKRQIYVFDDVCGKHSTIQSYVDKWKKHQDTIKDIIKKGKVLIIASCRLQVFHEKQFKSLNIFTDHYLDLSKIFEVMSKDIKILMARKYLSEENVKMIKNRISEYEFFPLKLSLFRGFQEKNQEIDAKDFFLNPFNEYTKEMDRIRTEEDQSKFCALFLLIVHNGTINESIFKQDESDVVRKVRENVFEECGISRHIPRKDLLCHLESFEGFLVKKLGDVYSCIHDKMFDFLCSYYGEHLKEAVIKYGHDHVIAFRTKFEPSTNCDDDDDDFLIIREQKLKELFFNRMAVELSDMRISLAFQRYEKECLENDKIKGILSNNVDAYIKIALQADCEEAIDYLISKGTDKGKYLESILDDKSEEQTRLTYACRAGDYDGVELLISLGDDVNGYDDNGRTPLGIAVKNGCKEIVELLLDKEADLFLRSIEEDEDDDDDDDDADDDDDDAAERKYFDKVNRDFFKEHMTEEGDFEVEYCPLELALRHRHVEIVLMLLHRGANRAPTFTCTVQRGDMYIPNLTMREKDCSDFIGEQNRCLLYTAIERFLTSKHERQQNHQSWFEVIKFLIKYSSAVNIFNTLQIGSKPKCVKTKFGWENCYVCEIAKLLINKVKILSNEEIEPWLPNVVAKKHYDILRHLETKGVNIDQQNYDDENDDDDDDDDDDDEGGDGGGDGDSDDDGDGGDNDGSGGGGGLIECVMNEFVEGYFPQKKQKFE